MVVKMATKIQINPNISTVPRTVTNMSLASFASFTVTTTVSSSSLSSTVMSGFATNSSFLSSSLLLYSMIGMLQVAGKMMDSSGLLHLITTCSYCSTFNTSDTSSRLWEMFISSPREMEMDLGMACMNMFLISSTLLALWKNIPGQGRMRNEESKIFTFWRWRPVNFSGKVEFSRDMVKVVTFSI